MLGIYLDAEAVPGDGCGIYKGCNKCPPRVDRLKKDTIRGLLSAEAESESARQKDGLSMCQEITIAKTVQDLADKVYDPGH